MSTAEEELTGLDKKPFIFTCESLMKRGLITYYDIDGTEAIVISSCGDKLLCFFNEDDQFIKRSR